MIDFRLTEDQIMLQRTAREFAQKEVKPVAKELDRKPDPKDCFSWELVKKAKRLGFVTAAIPSEYGGGGLDHLSVIIQQEEIAAADMGFAFAIYHTLVFGPEVPHISKDLRDEFLPKIIEDDQYLMAYSVTEAGGATEYILPYDVPGGGIKTFAEKRGDEYIINGSKEFSSNAFVAKLFTVNAVTNRELPLTKTWTQFLIPAGTPGFSIGKVHDFLGSRLLVTAEVVLEDVHVPSRYLLGEEGGGYQAFLHGAPWILTLKNCHLLGGLRALYEQSLEFAKTRVVCGKPIIEHPTIKFMLADMRVKIEAIRGLVWRLAWNLDHQKENLKGNLELAYLTKAFLNENALTIMRNADEIHGGMGTDKDMPVEKLIRDMFTLQHAFTSRSMAYLKGAPTLE